MPGSRYRTFQERPVAVKSRLPFWLTAPWGAARKRERQRCRFCDAALGDSTLACGGCVRDLPWIALGCESCGLPLSGAKASARCGECAQRQAGADYAFVPFLYASPVDGLIKELKFAGGLAAGRELAGLMWASGGPKLHPQVLVPVPLHWQRLAMRGYNQAQILASYLSRDSGVPVLEACRRVRSTLAQAKLQARLRTRNVRGAFEISEDVSGLSVAIVDDVITTGSTLRELVRVLRRAGASRVDVWAVARAIGS